MRSRVASLSLVLLALVLACAFCLPAFADDASVADAVTTLKPQAKKSSAVVLKNKKAVKVTLYKNSATQGSTKIKASGKSFKKGVWKNSKKSVASLSRAGKVTAKKTGKTRIVGKYGNKRYVCAVTVKAVSIDKGSLTMNVGASEALNLIGDSLKSASSSNPVVASVGETGVVRALSPGVATVTVVSAKGKKFSCAVTVSPDRSGENGGGAAVDPNRPTEDAGGGTPSPEPVPGPVKQVVVTGLSFESPEVTMELTDPTTRNYLTVVPSDATDKTIVFTSSNPNVAMVDESGYVTPVGAGEAVIQALNAASGITASYKLVVLETADFKDKLSVNRASVMAGDYYDVDSEVVFYVSSDQEVDGFDLYDAESEEYLLTLRDDGDSSGSNMVLPSWMIHSCSFSAVSLSVGMGTMTIRRSTRLSRVG